MGREHPVGLLAFKSQNHLKGLSQIQLKGLRLNFSVHFARAAAIQMPLRRPKGSRRHAPLGARRRWLEQNHLMEIPERGGSSAIHR
jgi:hypothetical protein